MKKTLLEIAKSVKPKNKPRCKFSDEEVYLVMAYISKEIRLQDVCIANASVTASGNERANASTYAFICSVICHATSTGKIKIQQ